MFFTREDILKIQNALLKLSVKDSELPSAEPVTYDDTLSIVQDGKNKQIKIEDFFNQISLWKREDFINITDKYDEHYISLRGAINLVPILQRKDGLVITFQDVEGNWEIYQFRGNITEFFEEKKWFNLYDYRNNIVQSIVPDEEDLTASISDENGNSLVSLKDRVYDPISFSGKGYKILRKNIQTVDSKIKNILTQNMINKPNTIYEIRYDFDLNGETIEMKEGCTLKFNGGSLKNGTINYNNTTILGHARIDCNVLGKLCNTTLNITYLGCIGDGITDNSDRFQQILNTFPGANLYVPDGIFVISKTIVIPGNPYGEISIYGNGISSILKITTIGYAFMYPYISGNSNQRVRIHLENFRVIGSGPDVNSIPRGTETTTNKEALSKNSFIGTDFGTYITFARINNISCSFLDYAINFNMAYWTRISNCNFENCNDAIYLSEANSSTIINCSFRGMFRRGVVYAPSYKKDTSGSAILHYASSSGVSIVGNDFSDCRYAGLHITGQLNSSSIIGNYFEAEGTTSEGEWIGKQIVIGESPNDNIEFVSNPSIDSCLIKGNRGLYINNKTGSEKYRSGIINYGSFTNNDTTAGVIFMDGSTGYGNIGRGSSPEVDTLANKAFLEWYDTSGRKFRQGFLDYFSSKIKYYHFDNVCIPANTTITLFTTVIRYFKFLYFFSTIDGITFTIRCDGEKYLVGNNEEGTITGQASMTDEIGLWNGDITLLDKAVNAYIEVINTTNKSIITNLDIKYLVNVYHK